MRELPNARSRRIFTLVSGLFLVLLSLVSLFCVSADSALDVVEQLAAEHGATVVVSRGRDYLSTTDAPEGTDPLDRLAGLGLACCVSPEEDIIVLWQRVEEGSEPSRERPIVAASRLVAALSAEVLEQREYGFVECTGLNPEARAALVKFLKSLSGWSSFGSTDVTESTIPDDLFLGVWPHYQLVARYVDEEDAIQVRPVSAYGWYTRLPPIGLPKEREQPTSTLPWWIWPYSEATWGETEVSGLNVAGGTVGELLSHLAKEIEGDFLLDSSAAELRDKPFCVLGETARLSTILWALEIVTGHAFHLVCADPFVFVLSSQSVPPRPTKPEEFTVITEGEPDEFWNSPVGRYALERAGYNPLPPGGIRDLFAAFDPAYVSPSESEAGGLLLKSGGVGDAGLPMSSAWRLEDLPDIYSWAVRWPEEFKQAQGLNRCMLLWIGGLEFRIEKRKDGSDSGIAFFLPEF